MNIQDLYELYLRTGKVSIDTRNIPIKSLFFALKGANFNGNQFAKHAIDSGASFAIVDEQEYADPANFIYYVEDCLNALQKLAQYHRSLLKIPVIAITGSNGKTTTKELITAVLSKKYKVLSTVGNLNNHIGVPLTLLSITHEHEIAVIEMGANHLREINFLSNLAQPDYGYITNFGKAHLEGFGGIEGVVLGKSELYAYLKENNKAAFVNVNDPKQLELTKHMEIYKFGTNSDLDFSFQISESDSGNCPILHFNDISIASPLVGNYNINNVAAATAIGLKFGVDINDIKKAIESYKADNNRSQIIDHKEKKIILDAYNANPSSMEAALLNFSKMEGSKAVILGDMFELGKEAHAEHQKIVDLTDQLDFLNIYFIGENFFNTTSDNQSALRFETRQNAEYFFEKNTIVENNILIKGSRGMALESILKFIT